MSASDYREAGWPGGAGLGAQTVLLTAYDRELAVLRHELLQAQVLLSEALLLLPKGETRHRIDRWLHR